MSVFQFASWGLITYFIIHYCIALNFQGSKFSQIMTFEDFVEIIHCTRTPHTQHTMGVAYRPGLSNAHCHTVIHLSSQLSAKQRLLWRYLFGESSLLIWQLSPGMLSINVLAVRAWKVCMSRVKRLHWNIFVNSGNFTKFVKLKTCENLALYGIVLMFNVN